MQEEREDYLGPRLPGWENRTTPPAHRSLKSQSMLAHLLKQSKWGLSFAIILALLPSFAPFFNLAQGTDVALIVFCGVLSGVCIFFSLMWQVGTEILAYRQLTAEEENSHPDCEDIGWTLIHADIFRIPSYPCVLVSLVATGGIGWGYIVYNLVSLFYPPDIYPFLSLCLHIIILISTQVLVFYLGKHIEKDIWCSNRGTQAATTIGHTAYSFAIPFTLFACVYAYILFTHPTVFLPSYFWIYALSFCLGCLALLPFALKQHHPYWRPWYVNQIPRLLPPLPGSFSVVYYMCSAIPFVVTWRLFLVADEWTMTVGFVLIFLIGIFVTFWATYMRLHLEQWDWWWPTFILSGNMAMYPIVFLWLQGKLAIIEALIGGLCGFLFCGSTLFLLTLHVLIQKLMYLPITSIWVD